MRIRTSLGPLAVLGLLVLGPLLLPGAARALPPIPETPAAVQRLVAARPYVADTPLGFSWDRSQAPSRRGWLLVIQADPGLTATRQAAEPNLFAGEHLAARAGRAGKDGLAVYLLPADVDLATAPLFFGEPGLPEAVTREAAQAQAQLAQERRLPSLSPEDVAAALAAGGAELRIATFADLREAKRAFQDRFIEASAPAPSAPSGGR